MADQHVVQLREITFATVRQVISLRVSEQQSRYVAPNATSIAEGLLNPGGWLRAIYAADRPVGFAMLFDPKVPGEYGPEQFYLHYGFVKTGAMRANGTEPELCLNLQITPATSAPGTREPSSALQRAQSAAGVLTDAPGTSLDSAPYLNRSLATARKSSAFNTAS